MWHRPGTIFLRIRRMTTSAPGVTFAPDKLPTLSEGYPRRKKWKHEKAIIDRDGPGIIQGLHGGQFPPPPDGAVGIGRAI
jgi:hypothetical protein